MPVLIIPSGRSTTNHETAMRNSLVDTIKLFLGNKRYSGIIVCKVVRHFLDFLLDSGKICSLLRYHEALSGMLLTGGKLRCLSVTDLLKCFRNRNGILSCINYAVNSTNGIGMTLAYTLAPECIVISFRKNCICI